MDISVEAMDGAAVSVQPPVSSPSPPAAPPRSTKHPSELTDAEYFALIAEMAKGPRPNYVEGTFRREDIYGDGEDGR